MRLLPALLLLAGTLAAAQSIVPRTIVFEGAPQFPQADLLKLSGLAPGTKLTQPEIEAAMNRLADSGLFTGVNFKTSNDTLTFTLEPSAHAQTQRVAYTNFVWYTPEQLNAEVHTRVPLFTGNVPADGNVAEAVKVALVAILKEEQGLTATVEAQAVSGGRLDYTITTPRVVVGELHIQNVDFDSDPGLANVRNGIGNSEFIDGITQKSVTGNLASALEELGYLDQSIGPITLANPRLSGDRRRVIVNLNGTATPGPLYKVATITFPKPIGNVTTTDFRSDFAVKPGGPPAPSLVANTTAGVRHAYERHGYLNAAVSVETRKNTADHTVSYTWSVAPDQLYRMRALVFPASINVQQKSILTQSWQLHPGDVYDEQIAESSLNTRPAREVCPNSEVKMDLVPDKATHEVDINLSCGRPIGK